MFRRFLRLMTPLLAALCLAGAPAPHTGAAPADDVFGPLKMTPIQIRVKIDALGRAYHARWSSDHDLIHDAVLAESSLRAWRNAYPNDPWLPSTAFHLEQLYQAMQTAEARKHAVAMLHYITLYWRNSAYGRTSRSRIAQGFPRLHSESPLHPTPDPYARATTAGATTAPPSRTTAAPTVTATTAPTFQPTAAPKAAAPSPPPFAGATPRPQSTRS